MEEREELLVPYDRELSDIDRLHIYSVMMLVDI